MTEFTGLLPETPEQRAAMKSRLTGMPVCAGGDRVPETVWKEFPEWLKPYMQGPTSSCEGHALAHAAKTAVYGQTGLIHEFSAWWAYIQAQIFGGNVGSDSGAYLGSGQEAAQKVGLAPLALAKNTGVYYTRFAAGVAEEAAKAKVLTTVNIESGGYDSLRTLLGQQLGGGVFAVNWPLQKDRDGNIANYVGGRYGHAMAWVALSDRYDSQGRPWIWCANSHEDWPRYLMSPTAVQQIVDRDDWGCYGILSTSIVRPRIDWRKKGLIS